MGIMYLYITHANLHTQFLTYRENEAFLITMPLAIMVFVYFVFAMLLWWPVKKK